MIAFTICSNNYISKAQVLGSSIKAKSGCKTFLIIADAKQGRINYDNLGFDEVLFPESLPITNLQWMKENYSIVEFNTALKPFAFQYLFSKTNSNSIYYFDPDIKVYEPIEHFESLWSTSSILLTPHILTPIPHDDKFPGENLFLNHGLYNLGFIGLRKTQTTEKFLSWWSERLTEKCVIDLKEGYFTDQIWANFVPAFFENVIVTNHPGLNASYWNLHERNHKEVDGKFFVNDLPLYFYHFSSFDLNLNILTPTTRPRYTFKNRPEMIPLYLDYKKHLEQYSSLDYKEFKYYDGAFPIVPPTPPVVKRVVQKIKARINK